MKNKELDPVLQEIQKNIQSSLIIVSYDENGKVGNSKTEVASYVGSGEKTIYKVMSKRGGKVYNPLNKSNVYGLDKLDKTTRMPMFKFKNVSKKCFDAYVKFLETKHDSYLSLAEREFLES